MEVLGMRMRVEHDVILRGLFDHVEDVACLPSCHSFIFISRLSLCCVLRLIIFKSCIGKVAMKVLCTQLRLYCYMLNAAALNVSKQSGNSSSKQKAENGKPPRVEEQEDYSGLVTSV